MDDNSVVLEDWLPGTSNYTIRAWTLTGVAIVYTIFVIFTLVMFVVLARNKRSGLEKLSANLVLIQSVGCYLVGVDGLVTAALNNWACFAKLWLFNIGFMLSLSAMSARACRLLIVYKVHNLTNKLPAGALQQDVSSLKNVQFPDMLNANLPSEFSKRGGIFRRKPTDSISDFQLIQQLQKYRRLLWYVSDRMLVVYVSALMMLTIIITIIINVVDKQFALSPLQTVCEFYWGFLIATVVIIIYFFVVFPIILWRVWQSRDAYGIRRDLIICDTVGVIVLALTLVWVNVLHETQQIWPGLSFIWILAVLIHTSSVVVPLIRAFKHIRVAAENSYNHSQKNHDDSKTPTVLKHSASGLVPSSRRVAFNHMLDDNHKYQKFRSFAVSCFCSELTAFIEEYQLLKKDALLLLLRHSEFSTDAHESALKLSQDKTSDCVIQRIACSTSITVDIISALQMIQPNIDNSDNVLQFPAELFGKLKSLYWNYVDPGSYTSVNASPQAVRRIANTMSFKSYPITILDELKNEVLFMLYSDVYTRFIQKLGT